MAESATVAASDYRGSQNNISTDPTQSTVSSQLQIHQDNRPSYVSVTKSVPKATFPKKEQAIVLNSVHNLKLADYVQALGTIISPKDIIFVSRIANNRICVYLATTQIVDKVVESHSSIKVGEIDVGLRRLITPAKRLILSNVSPTIPHEILEQSLQSLGLKLVSPITFLRAGIPGDNFAHILSFRRQVYVVPPIDDILSDNHSSLIVMFEDTQYRIYLSCDEMTCFQCNRKGHIANNCPDVNRNTNKEPQPETEQSPVNSLEQKTSDLATDNKQELTVDIDKSQKSKTTKRPPPSSTSSETEKLVDISTVLPAMTHVSRKDTVSKHKRLKSSSHSPSTSPVPDSSYQTIRDLFDKHPTQFPIDFVSFKSFLENSYGNNQPLAEARRCTDNIESLLGTMYYIYPYLPNRSLKSRFSRISNRIKEQLASEGIDTSKYGSFSSQQSQDSMDTSSVSPSSITY